MMGWQSSHYFDYSLLIEGVGCLPQLAIAFGFLFHSLRL